jgi:hypothetical protein
VHQQLHGGVRLAGAHVRQRDFMDIAAHGPGGIADGVRVCRRAAVRRAAIAAFRRSPSASRPSASAPTSVRQVGEQRAQRAADGPVDRLVLDAEAATAVSA